MARTTTKALSATLLAFAVQHGGAAQADPRSVTWEELRAGRPEACMAFLENYQKRGDCAQQTLMTKLLPERMFECGPGAASLDGQTIRIAGFVHPLEFEFHGVQEFLLLPRVTQECRHPPPPLPDQVISVEFPDGLDINADPVWVTGTLRLQSEQNHVANANYALTAIRVEPALIPDVTDGG